MAPKRKTFRSRVARRMFLVFALCALVPILTFAVYSFSSVAAQLEADAVTALGAEAKTAGMSIYEHFAIAHSQLRILAAMPADRPLEGKAPGRAFVSWGTSTLAASALSEEEKQKLSSPDSVLLRFERADASWVPRLYLAMQDRLVFGELDPAFVFTPERRRSGDRYWVEASDGDLLYSSADDDATQSMLEARSSSKTRTAFDLKGPAGRELGIVWPIFLQVPFRLDELRIGLSRSEEQIYRPLVKFERSFPMIVLLSLVLATALALRQVRRTLLPLDALTRAAEAMSRGGYDRRVVIETRDEFRDLGQAFNDMAQKIQKHVATMDRLHEIGRALSDEDGVENLLNKIVSGAAELLSGQACALYLTDDQSEFEGSSPRIASFWQSQGAGHSGASGVAHYPSYEARRVCETGVPMRLEASDARTPSQRREWARFHDACGFPIHALLAVPLRITGGDVLGALVVIREPPGSSRFADDDLRLVQSLASQAAVAIRQARSVESLRALFEGLIQLTVRAIDEKSPYTGDHCRKVPILTELIAEAADNATEGSLKDFSLTPEERYELKIAALLHDCGKMVTPVHVMDKATKLEGIVDGFELVRLRAEIIRRDQRIEALTQQRPGVQSADAALLDDLDFIEHRNIGGEFMAEEMKQRVSEIRARYCWSDIDGSSQSLLTDQEAENLKISRGTLNDEEREIINQHVVTTVSLLEKLPFPKELQNVPAIAGAHHEMVNGCGYPLGLGGDDLSMQGRILGLADVFEALSAKDRPYKPGKSLSESLWILEQLVAEGHLDPSLHELFVKQRLYLVYAAEQMDPSQIDGEHRRELDEMTEPWS